MKTLVPLLLASLFFGSAVAGEPLRCNDAGIVGAKKTNRADETTGPTLADAVVAAQAYGPHPLSKYADLRFLTGGPPFRACFEELPYRYSDGDRCSVEHLVGAIDRFGPDVFAIVDSGGAHSIAMGTELAVRKGYRMLFKLGSLYEPKGVNRSEQDLASFRYQYPAFSKTSPTPASPVAMVLDAHRGEKPGAADEVDNSAPFAADAFPTAAELKALGVTKVIWIFEGKTDAAPVLIDDQLVGGGLFRRYEEYENAPTRLVLGYREAGLEAYRFRVNPYDCAYSKRH